jgi:hypothetical protein
MRNQKSISPRLVLAAILILADLLWQIFREIKSGKLDWVGLVCTLIILVVIGSIMLRNETGN